ncbi:hypothetical protein BH11ARM2_BH11ARM2_02420 [soil metagenome]
MGWERLSNGRLLSAAEDAGFAVMVTVDKSVQFQQNMVGQVLTALENLQAGTVITLQHPDIR